MGFFFFENEVIVDLNVLKFFGGACFFFLFFPDDVLGSLFLICKPSMRAWSASIGTIHFMKSMK